MLINRVMSFAADPHGLLGYADGGPGSFDPETAASIRILLDRGFIERRERTVDIEPGSYGGNWTEIMSFGPTTIVTWHLTEAGRAHWLSQHAPGGP
jgi:hypothetical protein